MAWPAGPMDRRYQLGEVLFPGSRTRDESDRLLPWFRQHLWRVADDGRGEAAEGYIPRKRSFPRTRQASAGCVEEAWAAQRISRGLVCSGGSLGSHGGPECFT